MWAGTMVHRRRGKQRATRKSAYLPVSDTVQEMRVETANFDASIGHTTASASA